MAPFPSIVTANPNDSAGFPRTRSAAALRTSTVRDVTPVPGKPFPVQARVTGSRASRPERAPRHDR